MRAPDLSLSGEILSKDGSSTLREIGEPNVNERKLLAKIDLRILPILCFLFILAFIDR